MKFEISIEIFLSFIVTLAVRGDNLDPYDGTLKLVQAVFRHGDRNPIDPYPLFPYKDESYWPEGFAQLTRIGKMQHYELGQYLRMRYSGFLNESYSPYDILIQSSNVDRTIMSAAANLAGLYPPNNNVSRWNPDIKWQPIPVHTEPDGTDRLLRMNAPCPKYKKLKEDFLRHSPEAKELHKKYENLFQLLTNKTGKEVKTAEDIEYTYDALYIAHKYYGNWPEWAPEGSEVLKDMQEISKFSFQALAYTEEMQRLRGGPLVQALLQNFNSRAGGTLDKRRKFFMWSGHDTTLAVLLNTLGVFDPQLPPYASLVLFELWEQDNELNRTYNVKVLFKNETDHEPYELHIPGCGTPCSLTTLNKVLQRKIPDDWDSECALRFVFLFNNGFGVGIAIFSFASILIFVIVVITALVTILKNRQKSSKQPRPYPYLHLQQEDEEA